jgi:hypothetical protein
MIGGLNGRDGSTPRNDAVRASGIAAARMRAIAGAARVGTKALMEGAQTAVHCPWEQQKSQFIPFGMLLQGTSTDEYARRVPWNVRARSNTAAIVRRRTALFYQAMAFLILPCCWAGCSV